MRFFLYSTSQLHGIRLNPWVQPPVVTGDRFERFRLQGLTTLVTSSIPWGLRGLVSYRERS